jgi:membrane dipeptidase
VTSGPPLFDAHCDTILKVVDAGIDLFDEHAAAQVTVPGMRRAGVRVQVFACFVLSERHPGRERQRAFDLLEALQSLATTRPDALRIVTTGDHLDPHPEAPIGMILGLEGADPLSADPRALEAFHQSGVRWVIPAWKDNAFSGTAFGTDAGLSEAGRELIALAEELRIVVDVSHLSDTAFADVLEVSSRPIVASHSNCRAICPSRRNLTDGMIRVLAERGGVLGLNLFPGFLDPAFHEALEAARAPIREEGPEGPEDSIAAWMQTAARPSMAWITRHVLHAIRTGGEDCIGLGADLDGVMSLPEGVDSVDDLAKIPQLLDDAGLSSRQIEKVCWGNMHRVVTEILA